MKNINERATKERITLSLSQTCMKELKRRAKANFRGVSGELECILSDMFNLENPEKAHFAEQDTFHAPFDEDQLTPKDKFYGF